MVALDRVRLPFPTHYQRFTVATFAFLDSGSQRALRGPVRSAMFCPVFLAPAVTRPLRHPEAEADRLSDGLGFSKHGGGQ